MVLGGQYGSTRQIISFKHGTAVSHSMYSQLQLLTNRQSSQLLAEITVT